MTDTRRKLTPYQVRDIRAVTGNTGELARKYGVNPGAIWRIQQCETYRDLP